MGAINYFTSDYITLGVNPDEFDHDEIEFVYDEIKTLLEEYYFYYYHVSIEAGYYEGFSIRIESDVLFYNNYEEKREAQKEITILKDFLLNSIELGLVKVSPGWCTAYYDYESSRKAVNEAIKEMRSEAKNIPTAKKYFKECC